MKRHVRFLACLFFLLVLTVPADAAKVDLSWNGCSPLVADIDPDVAGPVSLYASVTGWSELHIGYELFLMLGDANNDLPDAWHFEDGGCQAAGLYRVDHLPPAAMAKSCPSLPGISNSLEIKGYGSPGEGFGFPATMRQAVLARVYPLPLVAPDPGQRYFLARFEFNHSGSVVGGDAPAGTCGGFDRGLRISLFPRRVNWASAGNQEVAFEIGQGTVTFRADDIAVPAANATWGQIKSQYRR